MSEEEAEAPPRHASTAIGASPPGHADGADDASKPPRIATASWVLYDLANTVFSFAIITAFFPVWLNQTHGLPDSVFAIGLSTSMAIVLVIAPFVGHVSDRARRRIPFLVASTVLCVLPTAVMGLFGWPAAVSLFVLANIGFQAGLIFYDSLLPVVSTLKNRGRVAAIGVGVGYIGSLVGLGAGEAILTYDPQAYPLVFIAAALLFWLFAMPAFFAIKEPEREGRPLRWKQAAESFKESAQGVWRVVRGRDVPHVGRFFLSRVLYTEAANTMIAFLAVYLVNETGFGEEGVAPVLAMGILGGILISPLWGFLADRIGHRTTLGLVILTWIFGLLIVVLVPVLGLADLVFYPLAFLLGGALGGLWSTDRPLLLELVPSARVGEFFGMYAMLGRFSAITGPLIWALIVDGFDLGRPAAVFALLLMMAVSYLVLRAVPDPTGPDQPPGGNFLPWRNDDGSARPWPSDWWRRFPGVAGYCAVAVVVFALAAWTQGRNAVPVRDVIITLGPVEFPLAFLAYEIPDLFANVPKTILNFGTAIWINSHPVQLVYVLVLLGLFAVPFEIREGTKRTALVFWGTSVSASIAAGLLLHAIMAIGIDAAWADDAWGRLWAGGSAGAFGIMGALAARAKRPWLLMLLFFLWEVNVEYWFLKSYTVAFHLSALVIGFAWVRWGRLPRQADGDTSAGDTEAAP